MCQAVVGFQCMSVVDVLLLLWCECGRIIDAGEVNGGVGEYDEFGLLSLLFSPK